jgi:hypothetical protein
VLEGSLENNPRTVIIEECLANFQPVLVRNGWPSGVMNLTLKALDEKGYDKEAILSVHGKPKF